MLSPLGPAAAAFRQTLPPAFLRQHVAVGVYCRLLAAHSAKDAAKPYTQTGCAGALV